MADLLPPSPSAAAYNPRVFAPSPSLLSSSIVPPQDAGNHATFNDGASTSGISTSAAFNLGLPRTSSPPPFDSRSTSTGYEPISHQIQTQHTHNTSITSSAISSGPPIRPLEYTSAILSHENTHSELARTVEDLTKWLAVVEVGLIGMLEKVNTDTIEEEQEEFDDDQDQDQEDRDDMDLQYPLGRDQVSHPTTLTAADG